MKVQTRRGEVTKKADEMTDNVCQLLPKAWTTQFAAADPVPKSKSKGSSTGKVLNPY
jgi:hypothetical protein